MMGSIIFLMVVRYGEYDNGDSISLTMDFQLMVFPVIALIKWQAIIIFLFSV